MNVCLVGDFGSKQNEGMRNTATNLAGALHDHGVPVQCLNVNQIYSPAGLGSLRSFNPDIIHYINGIGWKNVLAMAVLARIISTETVISAVHPHHQTNFGWLVKPFGPSMVFTQSEVIDRQYQQWGCQTHRVPNGVDVEQFRPRPPAERRELRATYDLPPEQFIILHVGHLTEERNVEWLAALQSDSRHIVVVSRESPSPSPRVVETLEQAGCSLRIGYVDRIEDLYAAADCYAYPVLHGNSIELPLSILEAMAANLPIVSTCQPGLRDCVGDCPDVHLVETLPEFCTAIRQVHAQRRSPTARQYVKPYTWDTIATQAIAGYTKVSAHGD